MKNCFILISLSVILVSCRPTKNLSFDVLVPAEINLPDKNSDYLVLNSSYLPESVSNAENDITYLPEAEKVIVDTIITRQIFDGLFSVLDESPLESLRNIEYLEIRSDDTTGFLNPLSPEAVSGICRDNNASFIISFEYYSFKEKSWQSMNSDRQYEVGVELRRNLLWRIYAKEGYEVDVHLSQDTMYWVNYGISLDDTRSEMESNLDRYREAFWLAGNEYGKRISPSWNTSNRYLYQISEKTDTGKKYLTFDKILLQEYCSSGSNYKNFKACYNISVIYESEGDIDNALKYINLALKSKNSSHALRYRDFLLNRKKKIDVLNQQTGKS